MIKFFLAVVLTEAITEIITKSEFFSSLREKIFKMAKTNNFFSWIHSLLCCGYCFSVWAGWLTAILFFKDMHFIHWALDWFFIGIVLHRLSNLWHNVMDRIRGEV